MDERIMQNTVALGIIKAAARFPFIAQSADTDCYTVLADAAIAELRADGYAIVPVSSVRADQEAVAKAIALELEPFRGEAGWLRMRGLEAHAAIQRVLAAYDALQAAPEPERTE